MEKADLNRLLGGIVNQAIKDFKNNPFIRTEVYNFFTSQWGHDVLAELGLSFDYIDKELNISNTINKHNKFIKALKTVKGLYIKPTISNLAQELNWSADEAISHCREYRVKFDKETGVIGGSNDQSRKNSLVKALHQPG